MAAAAAVQPGFSSPSTSFLCFFFCLLLLPPIALSSVGDQSPHFRRCISKCAVWHGCPPNHLRFAWWARAECFSCRNSCIWQTVEQFQLRGQQTPQFNGKWPFAPFTARVGPIFIAIQEPASVAFSLLNAFTIWLMMRRIRREVGPEWYCRHVWLEFGVGGVGLLTWSSSALFHCCDHWLTEMADYCSAFGLILFTFYASLRFILPQWKLAQFGPFASFSRRPFGPIQLGLVLFYLRYLKAMYSAPNFDYGFHMSCCVQIGLATAALFLCWTVRECLGEGRARPSMGFLGAAFALGWFSAAFDALLDFPPILRLFDAHSLFHLFSAPVPLLWAEFVCQEASRKGKEAGGRKRKEQKPT